MPLRHFVAVVAVITTLSFSSAVVAAEPQQESEQPHQYEDESSLEGPFGPGNLDFSAMLGLNSGYLFVEPSLDLGLVEVSEGLTLSAGGGLNLGWCGLCGVISLFTPFDYRGWYAQPTGRVALHINQIGDALNLTGLDSYVGVMAGPTFYSFTFSDEIPELDSNATVRTFGIMVGPMAGIRATVQDDSGLFVGFEARAITEIGVTTFSMDVGTEEDGTWVEEESTGTTVRRSGLDWNLNAGFRF